MTGRGATYKSRRTAMTKGTTKRGQAKRSTSATETAASHNPIRELRDAHAVRRDALRLVRQAVGAAACVLAAQGSDVDRSAARRLTRTLSRAVAELRDGGGIGSSMDLIALGPVA
jgi:hypothetical protein